MMSMKYNVAFNCGKYGQMSESDIGVIWIACTIFESSKYEIHCKFCCLTFVKSWYVYKMRKMSNGVCKVYIQFGEQVQMHESYVIQEDS